jgi:hypothetical protein
MVLGGGGQRPVTLHWIFGKFQRQNHDTGGGWLKKSIFTMTSYVDGPQFMFKLETFIGIFGSKVVLWIKTKIQYNFSSWYFLKSILITQNFLMDFVEVH